MIKRLVDAYPKGLTKDELERSPCGAARTYLRELRKSDKDWAAVLPAPGTRGQGGYRIAWPAAEA